MNVPFKQENGGTLFDENQLSDIIRRAVRRRRHIIAQRMTKILGRHIKPNIFAEFCRKSPGRRSTRFPAPWVRAFCEAVGSDELWVYIAPESSRRALSASAGIIESREAVSRAQEALGRVQAELAKLAEGKLQKKAKETKQ
jgi:hypothetical protein